MRISDLQVFRNNCQPFLPAKRPEVRWNGGRRGDRAEHVRVLIAAVTMTLLYPFAAWVAIPERARLRWRFRHAGAGWRCAGWRASLAAEP